MAGAGPFRGLNGPLPPSRAILVQLVASVSGILSSEPSELRPRDSRGRPGGLVALPLLPTVLVPDLHARASFLSAVLEWRPPGLGAPLSNLLAAGEANLVCLGDLFHSETDSAPQRWAHAYEEYLSGWASHSAMDEEMGLSLAVSCLVLETKAAYPRHFQCLKGNHDNVANEEGRGDHPFYKFSAEGEMVASWFERFYGRELLDAYRSVELELPVLALGDRFVASHAEPAFALRREDLIEYRSRPDVVEALIWTPNDGAEEGSVERGLSLLLGDRARPGALWFGGHRPVAGRYALRARGRYVQFHDPGAWRVAYLLPGRDPDPDRDIVDVPRPTR